MLSCSAVTHLLQRLHVWPLRLGQVSYPVSAPFLSYLPPLLCRQMANLECQKLPESISMDVRNAIRHMMH